MNKNHSLRTSKVFHDIVPVDTTVVAWWYHRDRLLSVHCVKVQMLLLQTYKYGALHNL